VTYLKKSSWAVKLAGIATVGEKKVSEAEFTATFARGKANMTPGWVKK
jgi:hypothetical protein